MGKKCIICGEEAKFSIKDTSDHYCEECAAEQFSDISLLVRVEDQARKVKQLVEEHESKLPDNSEMLDEEDGPDKEKTASEEES